jgi:polyhydroxyalkanoate synthesis regulator phasin
MLEIIKKSMLTGVGLALKTWDEIEELGKELQEKGKMTEKEGKKFLEELQQRYNQTQSKLESRVEESVKTFLKKADIVTGEELKGIKKEIRELKKIIGDLETDRH